MEGDAIYVEGIGLIAQYHSYLDTFWEKGICYFVRDYYLRELTSNDTQSLRDRISSLNCRIAQFEANRDLFLANERAAQHGLQKG